MLRLDHTLRSHSSLLAKVLTLPAKTTSGLDAEEEEEIDADLERRADESSVALESAVVDARQSDDVRTSEIAAHADVDDSSDEGHTGDGDTGRERETLQPTQRGATGPARAARSGVRGARVRGRGASAQQNRGVTAGRRGRGRAARRTGARQVATAQKSWDEWDNDDEDVVQEEFCPRRTQGLHLPENFEAADEISFFKLFFTAHVITSLVNFTNTYAWMSIEKKPSYALPDGSWQDVTEKEMMSFLGLLIYFSIIRIADADKYWSRQTLYAGLWSRECYHAGVSGPFAHFFSALNLGSLLTPLTD